MTAIRNQKLVRSGRTLGLTLAAAVLMLASTARADAVGDACRQLVGGEVGRCLAAGSGRYVNPQAARECGKLVGGQVTSCIGALAGKDFTDSEVQSCGALVGGQVSACFHRVGHPHASPRPPDTGRRPPPSRDEIRTEIQAALNQLQAGDTTGAAIRLQRLDDRLK